MYLSLLGNIQELTSKISYYVDDHCHGLRTPNEGINQRYLKIWAVVADKICLGPTFKFGSGSGFSAVQ